MNRNLRCLATNLFDEPFFQSDEFGRGLDLAGSRTAAEIMLVGLPLDEKAAIFGGNGARIYRMRRGRKVEAD